MVDSNSTMNKLVLQLKKDLPGVGRATLTDVARVVGGSQPERSMDAVAQALLESRVDVGRILAALLRCEWMSVRDLMQQSAPDNLQEQIQRFSESIDHFNVLQAAVIDGAQKQWQKRLENEHRQRVLAESRVIWATRGRALLYNYFREVPITAQTRVVEIDDDFLWLKLTPEVVRVFSVADRDKSAVMKSADDAFNISVGVHYVERDLLCLSVRGIGSTKREQRSDLRLQLEERITVHIQWRDMVIDAQLRDISRGGLKARLPGHCTMRRDEAGKCEWQLDGTIYSVPGAVRWSAESEGGRASAFVWTWIAPSCRRSIAIWWRSRSRFRIA